MLLDLPDSSTGGPGAQGAMTPMVTSDEACESDADAGLFKKMKGRLDFPLVLPEILSSLLAYEDPDRFSSGEVGYWSTTHLESQGQYC